MVQSSRDRRHNHGVPRRRPGGPAEAGRTEPRDALPGQELRARRIRAVVHHERHYDVPHRLQNMVSMHTL